MRDVMSIGRRRMAAAVLLSLFAGLLVVIPAAPAQAATKLTKARLYSVRVPAMCGRPAGRLVHGSLPAVPGKPGWTSAVETTTGRPIAAIGRFGAGRKPGAALSIVCDNGGVPTGEYIAFYTATARLIGAVQLNNLAVPRPYVQSISIRHGWVVVRWLTQQKGEPLCCASKSRATKYRWVHHRILSKNVTTITEKTIAKRIVVAANHEDVRKLRKYVSAHDAAVLVKKRRKHGPWSAPYCWNLVDSGWDRYVCSTIQNPPMGAGIYLKFVRWGTWKVTEVDYGVWAE